MEEIVADIKIKEKRQDHYQQIDNIKNIEINNLVNHLNIKYCDGGNKMEKKKKKGFVERIDEVGDICIDTIEKVAKVGKYKEEKKEE